MHTYSKDADGSCHIGIFIVTCNDSPRQEFCALFKVADEVEARRWVNYLNGGTGEKLEGR